MARRIAEFFTSRGATDRTAQAFPLLTDREREVLDLLAAGCGNREIARRLGLSEKTIREAGLGRDQ